VKNIDHQKLIENALRELIEEKSSTISRPIFSLFSKDTEAKKEYKKTKKETKEGMGAASAGSFAPALNFNEEEDVEKIEATEATGSASSGSYVGASFLAKNLNSWGPSKKTQLPGGLFVKPKEKCKTFPYCNQGDINALEFGKTGGFNTKLTKSTPKKTKKKSKLKEAIENVSYRTGLSESEILKILIDYI
jgi:hypothetical protein